MALSNLLQSKQLQHDTICSPEIARVYIRVSHEKSAERNLSPETQRELIQDYAERKSYKIVDYYTDLARSAFREEDERPAFDQMFADAKNDPSTAVILVAYFDRFSRSPSAQAKQEELRRNGIRIESATEGYYDPDTEQGIIMSSLTWSLSHMFSVKLRNRVVPCMKKNFTERDQETNWAYKNGGWALFGYKKHRIPIGKNSRYMDMYKVIWLKDDREFGGKQVWEWARTMFLEWRLKQGLGYDAIAGRLTAAGVPTPSGKDYWSNTTVQSLLADWDRYSGYGFWFREDCTNKKNRRKRDVSEWVVVENAHPAIISEAECDALWNMIKDSKPTKTHHSGNRSRWTLSGGLVKCKHCDANYSGTSKHGNDYYACGSYIYRRGEGCAENRGTSQEKTWSN